jgi:ankyrin repeat protein
VREAHILLAVSLMLIYSISCHANIFEASESGDLGRVRYYLDHGVNPNIKNTNDETPLHLAAAFHRTKVVKFLLDSGANVHVKNKSGSTPLHTTKNTEVVTLLIRKGADVNAKDNDGMTPLHRA